VGIFEEDQKKLENMFFACSDECEKTAANQKN